MRLEVSIDKGSGFCYGVVRAIKTAEDFLEKAPVLYSLGAIVHNETEMERLAAKGLVTIGYEEFCNGIGGTDAPDVLIRAHGEPPRTYRTAREKGYRITDCTCPVVLKLQQRIREAASRLGDNGCVVIFGKVGHAEVNGLVGQAEDTGCAVHVVEDAKMLREMLSQGVFGNAARAEVFSQTTKDPEHYKEICSLLREHFADIAVHDTICRQVSSRHEGLRRFAADNDAVVFVAGRESSNGKVLFGLCLESNPRTHFVSFPQEIDPEWFSEGDKVGVCGATSTPKWLLEKVAARIKEF